MVETRAVSDAFAEAVDTKITGHYGDQLRETRSFDALSGRSHVCRLRSESPRSSVWASNVDDPLYRRSVYPLRAWDHPAGYLSPRHASHTRTTNGVETIETTTANNAISGDHEVIQKVRNNVTGEDEILHRVRTPRGERISATRSLSPRATPRVHFDDLLDPRRRVLREDFLLDDLRTKTFNDRLDTGLSARSMYLDDPQWRRSKTHVEDPALNYYSASVDPLRRLEINSSHDRVHRYSALDRLAGDYRLTDPFHNDHLYRRTAYALDDPLNRRSAYLLNDPLYRRSAFDDPLYGRSALTGHHRLLR
jgi:hypothetical protein